MPVASGGWRRRSKLALGWGWVCLAGGVACCGLMRPARVAAAPRVLPAGQRPADGRLGPLKTLDGYFPFAVPETVEGWQARAARLRRQVLVSQGLWPLPTRTPLNAVVHGAVERDTYTVEKVFFESYPGHFVTGNLYRPRGRSGKLPGVLCPHGHWTHGRFQDWGEKEIRQLLARGEERFEVGGRYVTQSRCVQLARMGCVVFHYDMVGYADSRQLPHRAGVREALNTPTDWGYFSPQAELRLQTMMGLQTYNSLCALDFLTSLPEVDGARLGITGASGGGTQTFLLGAVDPRLTVAFPAVMVSTAMQGGCTCENAAYLRVDTGNIELAALFAPKPLGLSGADDWTKEIMTKGYPELKQLYTLLGAPDNVVAKALLQFGHNYNYVSRGVMYGWFNRHLNLGVEEPVVEEDYLPLGQQELSVWDDLHPSPPAGADYERSLVRWQTEDTTAQLARLEPHDASSLAAYREIVGGAIDVLVGHPLPAPEKVTAALVSSTDEPGYREHRLVVGCAESDSALPTLALVPMGWQGRVVIWAHAQGKAALFDEELPTPAVRQLLEAGVAVVAADLLHQGEFLADDAVVADAEIVHPAQPELDGYAGYTFGYNHSLVAHRVHDLLTLVSWARGTGPAHPLAGVNTVDLVGFDGAGVWVAAARAQAGDAVNHAVVDTAGFRFSELTRINDPSFWPGIVKFGDLPALLALSAPHRLWVGGEGGTPPAVVASAYRASGAAANCTIDGGGEEGEQQRAIAWLLH